MTIRGMLAGLALALAFASCATPYQNQGFRGGFSETQLDENVYTVQFQGNGYTSGERAVDFTLLRSAELALDHGFQFFVIVAQQSGYRYGTYTTPTQSNTTATANSYGSTTTVRATTTTTGGETHLIAKPGTSNTIVCLKERPTNYQGMVYNAAFVYRSITQKYGIGADFSYAEPPVPDGPACTVEGDCDIGKWCGRKDENTGRGSCIPIGTR